MSQLVFEYKRDGKPSGFAACTTEKFCWKPNRETWLEIPVEILKKNLRLMVRNKQARLIKTDTVEAVAVPQELLFALYYGKYTT